MSSRPGEKQEGPAPLRKLSGAPGTHLAFVEQLEDEASIGVRPDDHGVSGHPGQVTPSPFSDVGPAAIQAQQLEVP